jgi:hypothetical protein
MGGGAVYAVSYTLLDVCMLDTVSAYTEISRENAVSPKLKRL